ncbi:hypothetical protein ACIBBB_25170 [Streptomyces sp. NPDC051217]|uniref:hypothetical protein n=1 Tax=Streptomyces sp. NPDC051217 TaxID=3365644 RepID=UPI0037A395BA
MLEAISMSVVDERGERQCLCTRAGDQDDSDLRWARLLAATPLGQVEWGLDPEFWTRVMRLVPA